MEFEGTFTEGLPDDPGSYLCAFQDGTVETYDIQYGEVIAGEFTQIASTITRQIVAWAPVPAFPL